MKAAELVRAVGAAVADAYEAEAAAGGLAASNRASEIGWPCTTGRYVAYTRLAARGSRGARAGVAFERGRLAEDAWLGRVEAAARKVSTATGFRVEVLARGETWRDDRADITGRSDVRLVVRGDDGDLVIPGEVKATSDEGCDKFASFIADGVLDVPRFVREGWPWQLRWLGQIHAYVLSQVAAAHARPADWGLLIVGGPNRVPAVVIVPLDWSYGEAILRRAEAARDAVATFRRDGDLESALPPRMPFAPGVCDRCPFASPCLPTQPMSGSALELVTDPDFIEELDRWMALRAAAKDWERIDGALKARVKATDCESLLAPGGIMIRKSHRKRAAYAVGAIEYDEVRIVAPKGGTDE